MALGALGLSLGNHWPREPEQRRIPIVRASSALPAAFCARPGLLAPRPREGYKNYLICSAERRGIDQGQRGRGGELRSIGLSENCLAPREGKARPFRYTGIDWETAAQGMH